MSEIKVVTKEEFAKNLKYYYKLKGCSQKEIAEYVGVSTGTVCDWTKGRSYPRMDKIQKLAEFLDCKKSDLIEERSLENEYYISTVTRELYDELLKNPQAVELFRKLSKLSPEEIEIINSLVDKFSKEDK